MCNRYFLGSKACKTPLKFLTVKLLTCTNLIETLNFLMKKIAFKIPLKFLTMRILYPVRIL